MEILGVRIDNLSMQEVFTRIDGFLRSEKRHYIVLPYSEFLVEANNDESFRDILNQSDLSLCESRGLLLMMRFLGKFPKEQISGVELTEKICQKYQEVFLFGGREEVVAKVADKMGANIVGSINGYQDEKRVIRKINQSKPKILLVALGAPKQEKWIVENLNKLPSVKLAMGVGGSFDFISKRVKRAPKFFRFVGMEWAWRLGIQPWRARRIFNAVIRFPWLIIKTSCKEKFRSCS